MAPQLYSRFTTELAAAKQAWHTADRAESWRRLERAHILSQAHAWPHIVVHWHMLVFGVTTRNGREVAGQLVRLVAAGPGSWLGRAPKGNTGGANVGIMQEMPIPRDLLPALRNDAKSAAFFQLRSSSVTAARE